MSSPKSKIVATAALVICLICPILEVFDYWDRTAQTGNDTEYILVVLALCVGVAYAIARLVVKAPVFWRASTFFCSRIRTIFFSDAALFSIREIAISPPVLSLRI